MIPVHCRYKFHISYHLSKLVQSLTLNCVFEALEKKKKATISDDEDEDEGDTGTGLEALTVPPPAEESSDEDDEGGTTYV